MTIRAVMFDFGGVISSSPFEAFARFEAAQRPTPGFHPHRQRHQSGRQRLGAA